MPAIANCANAFEENFNVHFNDISRLAAALRGAGTFDIEGNKRYAQIGDSSLQLRLKIDGFERGHSPKIISNVIAEVAGRSNLAERGFDLGIDRYIQNNPAQKDVISDGLMINTMQAIIGAYFQDQNWDFAALQRVTARLGLTYPR